MARNITITFEDGSTHTYQNAPDAITPDVVQKRAESQFGKVVSNIDGGAQQPSQETPQESSLASQIAAPFQRLGRAANEVAGTVVEPVLQIGTGFAAKPIGELAAFGTMAANQITGNEVDPASMARTIQEQLTYNPRTAGAQFISQNILAPIGSAIESGAESLAKPLSGGSDIAAAGLKEAAMQGVGFLGVKGAPKAAAAIEASNVAKLAALKEKASFEAGTNRILKEGKDIGLIGPLSDRSRVIAGYANPEYHIAVKNTKTATKSLANEVGIKGPLTDDAVMSRVGELSQDYANVGKALGDKVKITPEFKKDVAAMMNDMANKMKQNPTAYKGFEGVVDDLKTQLSLKEMSSDVLMDSIRKFRETARLAEKRKEIGMVEKEAGEASYKLANMYENMIEQKLVGKKALLDKFRDSRTKLAQIHLLDSARMADDLIDMQKLGTVVGKYADIERPVTGAFKTVADFSNRFRDVSKPPSSMKAPAGGRWEIPAAAAGTIGGAVTGSPFAAIAAAPALARPVIHSMSERGMLQGGIPSYELSRLRKIAPQATRAGMLGTAFSPYIDEGQP